MATQVQMSEGRLESQVQLEGLQEQLQQQWHIQDRLSEAQQILEGELWTEQITHEEVCAELTTSQAELTTSQAELRTNRAETAQLSQQLGNALQELSAVKQQLATSEQREKGNKKMIEICVDQGSSSSSHADPRFQPHEHIDLMSLKGLYGD